MALASNNNLNPNKTVSTEDLESIVDNVAQKAAREAAEKWLEDRKKAQSDQDDPDHKARLAVEQANKKNEDSLKWKSGLPWGKGRLDPLCDKDPIEMDAPEKARMFCRAVQCLQYAKEMGTGIRGAVARAKEFGQETLAKALAASDFDSGGFMIHPAFAEGVIEEVVPRSVYVRALPGEALLQLPEGGMSMPYEDDGADAQWAGENSEVNAEEITGGQINFQPRKLIAVVPASNDYLLGAPGSADMFILRSIRRGISTKLDATLLRGVGASNEPNGLSGLMGSSMEFDATAEASLTQAILVEEMIYAQTLVEENNIDLAMGSPFYFMSPRSKNYLRAQRATDGKLFPEMEEGKLLGVGYDATGNIPNNVSASYSEIYFVAMAHMILGRTEEMRVGVFPGGTYNNSSGTKVSGVAADQTVFSVISKWDHKAGQRGNEIARINNVDWT